MRKTPIDETDKPQDNPNTLRMIQRKIHMEPPKPESPMNHKFLIKFWIKKDILLQKFQFKENQKYLNHNSYP